MNKYLAEEMGWLFGNNAALNEYQVVTAELLSFYQQKYISLAFITIFTIILLNRRIF